MAEERIYGYARVSTKEQNLDRQLESLKAYVPEERNIICDKMSGKDLNRPNLQILLNSMLRSGDTLYIHSLDRLGRRKDDIKNVLQQLKEQGVRVKILDLPTTMVDNGGAVIDMINNLLIEVLGYVAEQERTMIHKRQAEGIAIAKAQGKHLGRKRSEFPADWENEYKRWKAKEVAAMALMRKWNISSTMFYRFVKRYEEARDGGRTNENRA